MKWPLITNRSRQKTKQRFVSTWPQIWSNSVEISIDCQNASAPLITSRQHSHSHSHSRPHDTIFILLILAIGLSVASIVGGIFDLKSRNFGVLNGDFNVFDIDFKVELKSCEWDVFNAYFNDYDVSSSTAIDTNGISPPPHRPAINSSPTGVGLSQTSVIDNDLCAVSPAILIITNENKRKIKYESGPPWRHKYTRTGYTTTPAIGAVFNFSLIGAVFNIFGDYFHENYYYDDIIDSMFIFFFYFYFYFFVN